MQHEKTPSPADVGRWINGVCQLPLPAQATCIRLAAEQNLSAWDRWCASAGRPNHAKQLLTVFDGWLAGDTSDDEFGYVATEFQETLPEDLAAESDPAGGFAGWALSDIALVGLDQCEDVHEDIVHTAICYAAAAHAGVGIEAVNVNLERLSEDELRFLALWWGKCRERFPELRPLGGAA